MTESCAVHPARHFPCHGGLARSLGSSGAERVLSSTDAPSPQAGAALSWPVCVRAGARARRRTEAGPGCRGLPRGELEEGARRGARVGQAWGPLRGLSPCSNAWRQRLLPLQCFSELSAMMDLCHRLTEESDSEVIWANFLMEPQTEWKCPNEGAM